MKSILLFVCYMPYTTPWFYIAWCWYHILSTLNLLAGPQKIQKYYFLSMGPWEHPEWCEATRSGTGATEVPLSAKMTKMPLVNPGLTEGQTRSKPSQNNIFHDFTSNPSFSEISATLTKFDWCWLRVGPKTLILIQPSEQVETKFIAKIIKFQFQWLFMGQNRS